MGDDTPRALLPTRTPNAENPDRLSLSALNPEARKEELLKYWSSLFRKETDWPTYRIVQRTFWDHLDYRLQETIWMAYKLYRNEFETCKDKINDLKSLDKDDPLDKDDTTDWKAIYRRAVGDTRDKALRRHLDALLTVLIVLAKERGISFEEIKDTVFEGAAPPAWERRWARLKPLPDREISPQYMSEPHDHGLWYFPWYTLITPDLLDSEEGPDSPEAQAVYAAIVTMPTASGSGT